MVSLIILFFFIISSGSLFFVGRYFAGRVLSIEDGIATQKNQVSKLADTENLIFSFSHRLGALDLILSSRQYYSLLITVLGRILPDYVVISDVSLDKSQARLSGSALNFNSLASFISNVSLEGKGASTFSGAELTGTSLDKRSGAVNFSVNLSLKEGGLKNVSK